MSQWTGAFICEGRYLLVMLSGNKTPYLKFVSKKSGKPYQAALLLDEEYAVKLDFKERKTNN